jgi:Flp pilus assembly protein TadD
MQLTPDNWARVKEIVSNAMELNPEERVQFAERECNDDRIVLAEVLALLAADSQSISGEPRISNSGNEAVAPILKDRYIIDRKLEQGGFSTTFLALDRQLFNRRVVVKVLDSFSQDPYLFHKFQEELTALSSLEHPNIVAPLDGGQLSNGTPFIVMQNAEGMSLRKVLNEGPLPLERSAEILLQLGRTVGFIHSKGIYHRDLKPENIIVQTFADGTDHLRVIDFGIASIVEQNSSTHTRVIGTLNYMAPEQLRGEVCATTDVYAFGVIAYELVTGALPFTSNSPVNLADLQRTGVQTPPSQLRPQLNSSAEVLIERALEFQASRRPADIVRLAEDLAASLRTAGTTPTAGKRSPHDREARNKRETLSTTTLDIPAQPRRRQVQLRALLTLIFGLAVLVMAAVLWRELRRLPVVSARGSMLIGNLINATSDALFDDTLEQALAIQLQQSPYLDIVSEQQIQTVLIEMGRPNEVRITGALGREVCQRLNATLLLGGSIAALGHRYIVTLNAINCSTGGDVVREQDYSEGKEHILEAIGKLAANLRSKLGESSLSIAKFNAPLEQATTPYLDALKAFSQGIDLHDRKGDYAGSVPFFQRAIEIDSNFALAHLALAKAYDNVGKLDLARQSYIDAYAHRDRASEREHLNIIASYDDNITGNLEKAIQTSTLWTQTYPLDRDPHFQLLLSHAYLGNWDKALLETKEILRLEPRSAVAYGNLVWIYTSLNRYDEAKAAGEEALSKGLDSDLLRVNLYMLAFARNDAAGLTALANWAKPEHPLANVIVSSEADTAAYGGELKRARELTRRAVALATSAHAPDLALAWQVQADLRDALLGDRNHATDAYVKASSTPETGIRAGAVLSMALEPSVVKTRAAANELEKHFPEDTLVQSVYLPVIHAQLELVQGNPQKAIDLLQLTSQYELGQPNYIAVNPYAIYVRGEAYLAMRKGLAAQREFRKILDHRGIVLNTPIGALAHLGLARSYALQRDIALARTKYQDFLALWKNADPDIPVLKQALSEYARLH